MKRFSILFTVLALTVSTFATESLKVAKASIKNQLDGTSVSISDLPVLTYDKNTRTVSGMPARKAHGAEISWKRPAGQFWGTGLYLGDMNWYYFTPLVLRPWTDYTFENISTGVSGSPLWEIEVLTDPEIGQYDVLTANTQDVTVSYLLGESCAAPRLSYAGSVPFPSLFYGKQQLPDPQGILPVAADENVENVFGGKMPVSSHYYSMFTFDDQFEQGLSIMPGLEGYEGMQANSGMVFGTNSNGFNAVATRFEKPERPYLINSVHWLYTSSGEIPKDIPLKAYVYKTADPAIESSSPGGTKVEGVDLGELIAYSEAVIPKSLTRVNLSTVEFKFMGINPTTGVESEVSLEIDDDITIVVTGFDADLGNGQYVSSLMSMDLHDEGYGNLGFIGSADGSEEGLTEYSLLSMKDVIGYQTVAGVLADVSYPWLHSYFSNQPDNVLLANDGATTEEKQGLDYALYLMSTSMTSDFNITFNGEGECDWLSVIDMMDEMDTYSYDGQEYFTGMCGLRFQAEPNPDNVSRTCVVKISIPAASYEITFRQESTKGIQVPTPTASFENLQLILSCPDEEAEIYYTLNGSEPTAESTRYVEPLSLTTECIVRFFAIREGYEDSEVVDFEFIKSNYQVAKPSFSYNPNSEVLSINCLTEDAEIRYTTDGTEPTISSQLYTDPIFVESNNYFAARAFKEGLFDSEISYFTINIDQLEPPTASFDKKHLTLSCKDKEAEIYYMKESLTSAKDWTLYDNNPLELDADCIISFYAKRQGFNDSEIESFTFKLADYQVSKPILDKDFRNRKINITHPESLAVKVTIDGITEEYQTPVSIEVKTSMTSITVVALAADPNLYDSASSGESIRFHKAPVISYDGHTLSVSVANDDPIKTDAEVVCKFNDDIIGQSTISFTTDVSDFGNVSAYVQSDEAFYSVSEEKTIDCFNTGRLAGARNGHNLAEVFGTWNDKKEDYTYMRIVGEVNKSDLQLLATLPQLTTLHFDHSLMTGEKCDNIFSGTRIETLYFANTFPQGLLMGMPRLTTVIWGKTNFKMPDGLLTEAGNPNILLWVAKLENAPVDASNVVTFNDPGDGKATDPIEPGVEGIAETITLRTDYPFNVHKPIHFEEINVVKEFSLPTRKGISQGWESLILPFTPEAITHETKGSLVPFKAWDDTNSDAKPFWLYKATENGLSEAESLNALEPYIISMPNNPVYMDSYNLAGKVTFTARNIDLTTMPQQGVVSSWVNPYQLAGTFMPVDETDILSLNVHASGDGEIKGSEFVDYDETLPFGVYVRNVGDKKRIPLFGDGSSVDLPSMETVDLIIETPLPGMIRLRSNQRRSVGIYTTTGINIRTVDLTPGEIAVIEGLAKGIYICNGVKIMVE